MNDQKTKSALHVLECALIEFPEDVSIEITVDLKIHDDPPSGYVETAGGSGFQKVIDARNGLITKSITITFPL